MEKKHFLVFIKRQKNGIHSV